MQLKLRSPEVKKAYHQGFNAALEQAAKVAERHKELEYLKDVAIAQEIRALRKDEV